MAGGELARAQFLLLFFTFCSCCISRCISIPSEVTLSPVTHSLLAFQLPCNPRRGGSLDGTAIERAEKRDGGGWMMMTTFTLAVRSPCVCVCVLFTWGSLRVLLTILLLLLLPFVELFFYPYTTCALCQEGQAGSLNGANHFHPACGKKEETAEQRNIFLANIITSRLLDFFFRKVEACHFYYFSVQQPSNVLDRKQGNQVCRQP